MKRVLFVCIHNSARSQMAESYLNDFGKGIVVAESAGIEPGKLNPFVVEAMRQDGYDLSANSCNSVSDFIDKDIDFVITVCDEASAERCPIFPGKVTRLHWGFQDPSSFDGNEDEKQDFAIKVRDQIKEKIKSAVDAGVFD